MGDMGGGKGLDKGEKKFIKRIHMGNTRNTRKIEA